VPIAQDAALEVGEGLLWIDRVEHKFSRQIGA
jgi:hypothetical protein